MNTGGYSSWSSLVGMFDECVDILETAHDTARPRNIADRHDARDQPHSLLKWSRRQHETCIDPVIMNLHDVNNDAHSSGEDENRRLEARVYSPRTQDGFGNPDFAHFAEFLTCMSIGPQPSIEHDEDSDHESGRKHYGQNLRKRARESDDMDEDGMNDRPKKNNRRSTSPIRDKGKET